MDPTETTRNTSEQMRLVMSLWTRHQGTVSAYIASVVRDRHHLEDLTQEVASIVAAKVDVYDPQQPFLPWCLGIARNLMLKYLRTQRRDRHVFDDELLGRLAEAHEDHAQHAAPRKAALHDCLGKLPENGRQLLKLRYFEDRTVTQLAQEMQRTEGAVSMLLFRLREKLAGCIRRHLRASGEGRP